ncbi:Fe(3+)-hydroxamate ABC transporter substrate-binding protein FhuD [Erwinia piriflorinigrans]|uniref:Ferrichrome ABC transport system, periplasmic protein n=1 Tax=Erwinia piriflorinigrans CFBP 5888 TaxID=1161919 RepID=V5ZB95_9GAMM|nr:Fe(3+)-hydroxamate ABC transporter substrate-binding protein FhuD [Erwinia piriflorinigrans]CCG88186.1 Ferrichrome ABC transport system, periplasmic protein precursor [Erwinia piriflorinigrans CFBP 5888]
MPDLPRRRLLTALAFSPLLVRLPGVAHAASAPRIIALEWLPLELLMALGVMPLGAAELHNYRLWVGKPELPPSVVDVGLRTEPNLELITQMQPSLILYSQGYGPAPARLQRIAPHMGFTFNDGSDKPLTSARHALMALANRIDRVAQAQTHLAQLDALMQQVKTRLAGRAHRPLLLMSILDARHAIVFTANGLFQEVMDHLGLENAWQGEKTFWGSAVIGIERLANMHNVEAICFEHGNENLMQQVTASPLWQSMPFVRERRFRQVPRVWFYGATLSAMQFIHCLDRELGEK